MGGNGGDEGGGGDGDGGGGGGGGGGGRGGEGGGGEDGGGDEDGGTFTDVCGSSGSSELLLLSLAGMISASTTFALGPLPARASSMAAAASTASAVAGGRLAACSCMLVQSVVAFCSRTSVVQSRTNLEARKPAFGATLEVPAHHRLTGQ